jgi:5'-AMP-activated protein kinase, catalytic alpha subunit
VVDGLAHIHKNSYIHCDIKLENILVDSESDFDTDLSKVVIKISDFGLS